MSMGHIYMCFILLRLIIAQNQRKQQLINVQNPIFKLYKQMFFIILIIFEKQILILQINFVVFVSVFSCEFSPIHEK